MEIAICDDEKVILQMTANAIEKHCKQHNFSPKIHLFQSVHSLINCPEELDAIFLDIGFPDCDGIFLSGDIRERHKDARIILLTCHTDRYKDGYRIGAFRFLTKPLEERELAECMAALRKDSGIVVTVLKDGAETPVQEKDIYYLSAEDSYTEIWSEHDVHRTYGKSLAAWEAELPLGERFCRCHKKYIVNLRHVEEIDHRQRYILMDNGMKIPVARRRLRESRDCFMQYDITYR